MSWMVLLEIVPDPAPAPVVAVLLWSWMPRVTWAVPVPLLVRLATMFPEIRVGGVRPVIMPMTCWPVAAVPAAVTWMLLAVVALPIALFIMVTAPPVACMPLMLPLFVAGLAVSVNDPMMLFEMLMVPAAVPEAFMPMTADPVPVARTVIAPLPVGAPTVFPVMVPTLTAPEVTLIPVRAPVVVPRLMAVIVFPWMLFTPSPV